MQHKSPQIYISIPTKLALPRSQQLTNFIWHNPMNTKQTKNHGPQFISYRTMKEKVIHRFPSTFTLATLIDDLIMYHFDVQFLCKIWKIKDKEQELLNMKISIVSIILSIYRTWIYIYIYITYQESNEG